MSLSTIVSDLRRAQMGAAVPKQVTDEDLDACIKELLLKDAKKREERYGQSGIKAYLSNNLDSNAPRTNKRFLTSIIKSTDEHNKAVLKAQADAAEELKVLRLEKERRERVARAEEAVAAERERRSGHRSSRHHSSRHHSSSSRTKERESVRENEKDRPKEKGKDKDKKGKGKERAVDESESWDRWDGRNSERKRKARDWETWDGEDTDDDVNDQEPSRKSRRHDERSHRRSRSRSPTSTRKHTSKHPKQAASPSPGPPSPISSKMDRYFASNYDPRTDLTAPTVPSTGLLSSAEFEGWDAMLDLLEARKHDKEEKKRLQRLGLSKDEIKASLSGTKRKEETGIMDIKYEKRGAVREWDMGKKQDLSF